MAKIIIREGTKELREKLERGIRKPLAPPTFIEKVKTKFTRKRKHKNKPIEE